MSTPGSWGDVPSSDNSGAVLPSVGEPQAPGPVPQPTRKTCCTSYRLEEVKEEKLGKVRSQPKRRFAGLLFPTPTGVITFWTLVIERNGDVSPIDHYEKLRHSMRDKEIH